MPAERPCTAEAYAPYFETALGVANFADGQNTRKLYLDSTYGTDEQRYRYPIDHAHGIFPYKLGGGIGEPYVIYHTSGITNGIVIGYANEATCAE